uniref:FACT complex subunit n=1 Tax=Panagrolaimus sp. ES5 TaxID=591445 RepID=A0AC34FWI1_9BILA
MASKFHDRFKKKLKLIFGSVNRRQEVFRTVDSCIFVCGNNTHHYESSRTRVLHEWLFERKLSASTLLLTQAEIFILCSSNEDYMYLYKNNVGSYAFEGSIPPIKIFSHNGGRQNAINLFQSALKKAGSKVGYFGKDKRYVEITESLMQEVIADVCYEKLIDVSLFFAEMCAITLPEDVAKVQKSCLATINSWKLIKSELLNIIENKLTVYQVPFANEAALKMIDPQNQQGFIEDVEICYTPIVQSGGKYVLKYGTISPDSPIDYGCIVGTVGCRYRSYCSNVGRTMLLEPSDELVNQYETAMALEEAIFETLKPGVMLKDVYKAGLNFLEGKDPFLIQKLSGEPFGFATGLEFCDEELVISSSCSAVVQENMTFIINVGFVNLFNNAALFVSDTVLVVKDGPAQNLTVDAMNDVKSFIIRLNREPQIKKKDAVKDGVDNGGKSDTSVPVMGDANAVVEAFRVVIVGKDHQKVNLFAETFTDSLFNHEMLESVKSQLNITASIPSKLEYVPEDTNDLRGYTSFNAAVSLISAEYEMSEAFEVLRKKDIATLTAQLKLVETTLSISEHEVFTKLIEHLEGGSLANGFSKFKQMDPILWNGLITSKPIATVLLKDASCILVSGSRKIAEHIWNGGNNTLFQQSLLNSFGYIVFFQASKASNNLKLSVAKNHLQIRDIAFSKKFIWKSLKGTFTAAILNNDLKLKDLTYQLKHGDVVMSKKTVNLFLVPKKEKKQDAGGLERDDDEATPGSFANAN